MIPTASPTAMLCLVPFQNQPIRHGDGWRWARDDTWISREHLLPLIGASWVGDDPMETGAAGMVDLAPCQPGDLIDTTHGPRRVVSVEPMMVSKLTEADFMRAGVVECPIPPDEHGPLRIGYMVEPDDGLTMLQTEPWVAYRRWWSATYPQHDFGRAWAWRIEIANA